MENKSSLKVRVQKLGTALSNMVMPNIGAFIAWGILTTLFIDTGWLPNPTLNVMVSPILTYLLPVLIGYTGGYNVYGQRGGVVGAIATFGAVVGAGPDVPMFIGAMIMGPLGAWCIKKFDQVFQDKVKAGFEMLVNNFSAGIIGFILIILAFLAVGPIVSNLTDAIGVGVQAIVEARLLPLANILIEPAKILFLNNALNHGIFTPLGAEQVAAAGKSILFLLETNPGPGLGVLLAFAIFGKGSAKSSSWGAMIIHFLGGIHEIYFPYVMMKPLLFLAVIAGGVSGTFTFQLLGAGLSGAASPGSIIAILAMTPRGGYLPVLAGVFVATAVSFLVAAPILKTDKSDGDSLAEAQAATQAAKAESKGQSEAAPAITEDISADSVQQIIFACDAGMGSSAMGASILRDKVKKAGLDLPVSNKAISNLTDTPNTLIVTQEELADRAAQKTPSAVHVAVDNFLATPKYDDIVSMLAGTASQTAAPSSGPTDGKSDDSEIDLNYIDEVVFAYDQARGSATMGQSTLEAIFKNNGIAVPVSKAANSSLGKFNAENILLVTTIANQAQVQQEAPKAQILVVDSLVTTPEYDKMVARMHK
ncbi:PTS mannitol-specific transporter subunit IIBC [Streptococcus sp. H49]|uniref:PTS mannitol-specific transporter subunit IIBC n=1 Tax=Streptococcus huangxiaojuni TaxID=3237239 RepID=UPI0034A20BFD